MTPKEKIKELLKSTETEFIAPVLTGEITIPAVCVGASGGNRPHILTNKEQLKTLGYPTDGLPDNWKEVFLKKMAEMLEKYRSVKLFLKICSKCGNCADKCHFFLGSGDPLNMPVARADLMRKVYKRYFTFSGMLGIKGLDSLLDTSELTEELLALWYTYFYQCTECRRCSVFCPYGIDTAEITMAAREILNSVGLAQKNAHVLVNNEITTGNNFRMSPAAFVNIIESIEDDLRDETGIDIKIPIDIHGAEVLMVLPSADYFAPVNIESLHGYAKVFHQSGISWTLSSYAADGANFGLFVHNYDNMKLINSRIWKAARELKVKRVIAGECGHMWRVMSSYSNTMNGPFDWLSPKYPVPQHICEFSEDLIKRGALKFDKTANDHLTVTMHDSCQIARGSAFGGGKYGQFEIPRSLIRATCNRFVEMDENTIREKTFCCGAGGGLLGDEQLPVKLRGATPRMQAYTRVKKDHGANFIASICAYCKVQFTHLLPEFGYTEEEVGGIHKLISDSIILGAKR